MFAIRSHLIRVLQKVVHNLTQAAAKSSQYSKRNFIAIGWVGVIGFPSYYVVWNYIFPQPYENAYLRLTGVLMFLPFILIRYWPDNLLKYLPIYWLAAVVYALPFFFTFMLLMNDASAVWGMSTMAAVLLLFLVMEDWLLINLIFFFGCFFGWLAFSIVTNNFVLPLAYLEQLPIYLFSLIAGTIFLHRSELLRRERSKVMSAIGSGMAHELRTPLQGIQSGVVGLNRYVPALLQGYHAAQKYQLDVPKIRKAHLAALESLLKRIENEVGYSHGIIDMLLINSGRLVIDQSKFEYLSVRSCTELTLERYPFSSEEERALVTLEKGDDFEFYGSDIIYSHIIFNLIKNALWFIQKADKGVITLNIESNPQSDCVIFRDTGTGIDPEVLPYIFDQFFSTREAGKGAGLGLPYCQMAMESFGGTIQVHSKFGCYTEFRMCFRRCENE